MSAGEIIEFTTSWPPSVNAYWGTTRHGRHYLSQRGKLYREEVLEAVTVFDRCFENALVSLEVALWPPADHRQHDIDNPLKPILDALEKAQAFHNDNQVMRVEIRKLKPEPNVPEGAALIRVLRFCAESTSRWPTVIHK